MRATGLDANAKIQIDSGEAVIPHLGATTHFLNGQIEMIWGTSKKAKEHFSNALQIVETPEVHYMLGLLYESEYKPKEAQAHFEKCLDLDPDGELSVPALREANAMRNYKKRSRGSWGTFIILLILIWPVAIWYFIAKRK